MTLQYKLRHGEGAERFNAACEAHEVRDTTRTPPVIGAVRAAPNTKFGLSSPYYKFGAYRLSGNTKGEA